jgi:hypothetical protein
MASYKPCSCYVPYSRSATFILKNGQSTSWWYPEGPSCCGSRGSNTALIFTQDLVARDEHISQQLKEEAATLQDIILTEVRSRTVCVYVIHLNERKKLASTV